LGLTSSGSDLDAVGHGERATVVRHLAERIPKYVDLATHTNQIDPSKTAIGLIASINVAAEEFMSVTFEPSMSTQSFCVEKNRGNYALD